jgi:hypothetical protein
LPGILPDPIDPGIARDGSGETVDVSRPGFGPNFRLILEVPRGGPISGVNALAGGNYDPGRSSEWKRELTLWATGRYRPFR